MRPVRWFGALGAVALLAAGCGGDGSSGASGDDGGGGGGGGGGGEPGWAGELVIGTSVYDTLDPVAQTSDQYKSFQEPAMAILDTLLRFDRDGEVQPQLAESMETEEGLTWTMTLQEGLEFTDGEPLDADAVVFNVERQRESDAVAGQYLSGLESVTAIDERTIEFRLAGVDAVFDELFTGLNGLIASPAALAEDPEDLVGAGAYTMEEVVPDSHILLRRNPDYWDPTKPTYETIRYRQIPDALARGEALAAGDIDIAQTTGAATVLQIGDLEQAGLKLQASNGIYLLLMNHSRGPAQDIRIREAISIAFDPERVDEALIGGLWSDLPRPLELPCPPFQPDDPECVEGTWPEYDPERAEELIAEYVAEGNSVSVDVLGNSENLDELEFIQQTLNAVGMDISVNALPTSEFLTAVTGDGTFDLAYWSHIPPIKIRTAGTFHSEQRNLPRADVPGLDEAIEATKSSLDPDERLEAWAEVQRLLNESFVAAWYGPWIGGNVMREEIDLGDQPSNQVLWVTELAPTG